MSGRPEPGKYTFSLLFKANGVERSLGEPVILRLHVDPRSLEFAVLWVLFISVGLLWVNY
jgi:hypothetical protein